MRLLSWLLCAAAAIFPVMSSEERNLARPKRESTEKKIVCYYTNWSVYRPGTAKFSPQNINPYLCTHLIYAFGGLSKDNALKPFDKYQDIEQGGYAKFNGLKTYNKNLKTMLAIGGWNEGSARFSPLVADAERRKELVKNTVKFLRQNHFDGLDLDWEYPSFRDGGKPRDRDNYATLVQEFREEFERESEKTGRPRLLLTMAVPAGIEYIDKGYDVPKLNKYLDWMNILSYDYHSAFEPAINHHSPLFSLEEDDEYNFDAQLNIDYTVKHYIKLGADRNKLVLGIPTYGRSYTLFNADATDIGSPADGPGEQGEATREKGYLAYYEICERVKTGGWSRENPYPDAMGPYAYKDNQWVGYDDEEIARSKAKYVNDNDLGGIMFWSIDNDDFRGKCHGKPYPLIEAAKEALLASANELVPTNSRSESGRSNSKKQEPSAAIKSKARSSRLRIKTSTTTESAKPKSGGRTTTTPQPPTTPDPGSDFICKDEGFFPHPRDCKKYFWCLDSGPSSLGIVAHQFTCPSGLVFNKISDSCDYARNVICKNKSETTSTTTTTTTTTSTTTPKTTTVRARPAITASPPRTTTTTTTELPEYEEEEEEEDEEDPGTIKELINLIKKLGGVEQLEKQLNLQNFETKEKIKPSLYSKVLQGRTTNKFRSGASDEPSTPRYLSILRNRPSVPQSASTEGTSSSNKSQERLKYVTIQRNRPTKKPSQIDDEVEEEDEGNDEEEEEELTLRKRKENTSRNTRRRPHIDVTTEKDYIVLRRTRPQKDEEEIPTTSKYKNVVRVRSTTESAVEEDEEEVEETDEEISEEDEDGQEEKEKTETAQKLKKYSSIIRDKKILTDEEETKVSGPRGPQYENPVTTTAPDSIPYRRDDVNNVHTITSPRYVEIRRTQSPTVETPKNSVNIVYNSREIDGALKQDQNEVSVNDLNKKENNGNSFNQRPTTENVRRVTRPAFRSFTTDKSKHITLEPDSNEIETQRFKERYRSTTEVALTSQSKPSITQYKILHRNNTEKPGLHENSLINQIPKRERIFGSTETTKPLENYSPAESPRRFQFAPRTKSPKLSPKFLQSTTEIFTITVPDHTFTENVIYSLSNAPSFPTVTLDPSTSPSPSVVETQNGIDSTLLGTYKFSQPRRFRNSTTSTQTTIVTSITESSVTERKRIFIPKNSRSSTLFGSKFKSPTTPATAKEPEVTKRTFRSPGYNTIVRSAAPASEPTNYDQRRNQKWKSITSTTEEPQKTESRYVPKKIRNSKKPSSTEAPETTSTSLQKSRFISRNRPRQPSVPESANSPFSGIANARKKIVSKKQDGDDLNVEQTVTYFGNTFQNKEKQTYKDGMRQSSKKFEPENSGEATITFFSSNHTGDKTVKTLLNGAVNPIRNSLLNGYPNPSENDTKIRERDATTSQKANTLNYDRVREKSKTGNNDHSGTPVYGDLRYPTSTANPFLSNFRTLRARYQSSISATKEKSTISANGNSSAKNKNNSNDETLHFETVTEQFIYDDERAKKSSRSQTVRTSDQEPINSLLYNFRTLRNKIEKSKSTALRNDAKTTSDLANIVNDRRPIKQESQILNNYEKDTSEKFDDYANRPDVTSKKNSEINNNVSFKEFFSDFNAVRVEEENPIKFDLLSLKSYGTGTGESNPKDSGDFKIHFDIHKKNYKDVRPGFQARKIDKTIQVTTAFPSRNNKGSKRLISSSDDHSGKISIGGTTINTLSVKGKTDQSDERNFRPRDPYKLRGRPRVSHGLSEEQEQDREATDDSDVNIDEYLLKSSIGTTFGLRKGISGDATKSYFSLDQSTLSPSTGIKSGSNILLFPHLLTDSKVEPSVNSYSVSSTGSIGNSIFDPVMRAEDFRSPATSSKDSKDISSAEPSLEKSKTEAKQRDKVKSVTLADISESEVKSALPFPHHKGNFRAFRNRNRQISSATPIASPSTTTETITKNVTLSNSGRLNFRSVKSRLERKENAIESLSSNSKASPINYTVERITNGGILLRGRPFQSRPETKENEVPSSTTPRSSSSRRGNQEYFIGRNKFRSTTTQSPTTERPERRRTQLDRRRFRQDFGTTTLKPEILSETSPSTSRISTLLRRRTRPTTTSTTPLPSSSTTEDPYSEVQEDSSLEESKTLDESPDIQDLADPAVVAIHTLATVSPGSITSAGRSLNYYPPDTYTVHVTPGDIQSITPGRISTIAPGSITPTSILTLKPFTIPVITKQPAKQNPIRAPSPFRGAIPLVTEEPYSSRGDITDQPRGLGVTPKSRPLPSITPVPPQKSSPLKSGRAKAFSKIPKPQDVVQSVSSPEPPIDYEYYDDEEDPLANIPASALKVKVHSNGYIECLDRGNFPHPFSCKKFISCAKMENNELLGWEYTCPKHLSFDPVGGICNWSAGLGCQH